MGGSRWELRAAGAVGGSYGAGGHGGGEHLGGPEVRDGAVVLEEGEVARPCKLRRREIGPAAAGE